MPVYDYECRKCGHREELILKANDDGLRVCPTCEKFTLRRIISASKTSVYLGNQDATWLKTSNLPVDPDSQHPVDKAFREDPTRANRKAWMKLHGKIEYEPGMRMRPEPRDPGKDPNITRQLLERHHKRNRIEIHR
jgi:putative FmdB family regulatory protein